MKDEKEMPEVVEQTHKDLPRELEQSQQARINRFNSNLKERLGYPVIYSRRDAHQYFNNLSSVQQQELITHLKGDYYKIIISYFLEEEQANQAIDRFVEKAFFADISMDKVVEIHMELIDNLADQLKLRGLSQEYLSEYRLTLIDVIAHLGEMYRSVLN